MSLLVLAAGCLFGAALAVFDHGEVRVESKDGRYHSVRVSTGGYVRLVRTLSDAPCREGRNWGYDNGRIWVDDGCRAVFAFGREDRRDDQWNNGNWNNGRWDNDRRDDRRDDGRWNNGRWNDNQRWNNYSVVVRLQSRNGHRDSKSIANRDARIVRRLSDTPCREGYNWGRTPGRIWVDDGCRADFEVWTR